MKMRSTLVMAALLCLAVTLPGSKALAQEKQQISFKTQAENMKFTQQLNIELRDVPNHIVRVYEGHATFPSNDAPVINGLKIVEEWGSGTGDRIDGNGPDTGYSVFIMENGDKFFARYIGQVQNNSGKFTETSFGPITGGTGKLLGIQGTVRVVENFTFGGVNDKQSTIEYSIGK
jgi:hypothetical protein